MRPTFPLFNTPIDLAHHFWKKLLQEKDIVIDATCGNGKDSLVLAKLLHPLNGSLLCIDIQKQAIENTENLLKNEIPDFLPNVEFLHQSHCKLPPISKEQSLKLIVWNLGYLPKGDKSITTKTESTWESIAQGMETLSAGGVICITCYPGHLEGKKEQEHLLNNLSSLNPHLWCFTSFFWPNRHESPSLFFIQKKDSV
jgi:16S rRNA G1207 methylase RsmC